MKRLINVILLILTGLTTYGQTDCYEAKLKAQKDYKKGNYYFHSLEFLPTENAYLFVLKKDYNIWWRFTDQDSLAYYDCYDSALTDFLVQKYGQDFLKVAKSKADSLESQGNVKKNPEFPGGNIAMFKYILNKLKFESGDLGKVIQTKIIIRFIVTKFGDLQNIKVLKGISNKIDKKVIRIFKAMPKWKPAYLFGKPIKQSYICPIILEFE